jgi:HEAT repeat protein
MDLFDTITDLNHADQLIRQAAYTRLLDMGREAVPDLLDMFPQIGGGARLSVLRALGEIGDPRAVRTLLDAMCEREPDSYFLTPSVAARALREIGGEQVVTGLREHLEEHPEPVVRRMAVVVLRNLGDDDATDALRVALRDGDDKVRGLAVDALRQIGSPRAYAYLAQAGFQI